MGGTIRVSMIGTAAVLALGVAASVVTSTVVVSRAIGDRTRTQVDASRDITVKGSARRRVVSDTAVWDIAVSGSAEALEDAYASLEAGVERVRAFLAEQGFADAEVGVAAISTGTHYKRHADGSESHEVAAYTLSRLITVTTVDVERTLRSAGLVTSLIREGVLVASQPPQYYFNGLPALRASLLGEASADARTRAEEIVSRAGGAVGAVRDAQMGVMQVTRPNSTEVSSYGIYDTSTIEKDVAAVVTVRFAVVR